MALAGTYPAYDATVIRRLREAGAIIFMKTNMDELALGSQGLSSAGGQTLNPYDLRRHPGGSSGGSAVAVNAGFATVGLVLRPVFPFGIRPATTPSSELPLHKALSAAPVSFPSPSRRIVLGRWQNP